MSGKHLAGHMWADHDFIESDFESLEMRLDEPSVRFTTAQERTQKDFEKLYARYCRKAEVKAMDQVTALRVFLDMYPHFRMQP